MLPQAQLAQGQPWLLAGHAAGCHDDGWGNAHPISGGATLVSSKRTPAPRTRRATGVLGLVKNGALQHRAQLTRWLCGLNSSKPAIGPYWSPFL